MGTLCLSLILMSCKDDRLGQKSIVREGIGVDDFEIGTLTVDDVKSTLGDKFEEIKHHSYSTELFYKDLGTSFYYKVDSPEKIFAISFDRNFKGKTHRGFEIQKMNVADMLKLYGSADWRLLESAKMVYAHYDKLGIYFAVTPRGPIPGIWNDYENDSINDKRINSYYDSVYNHDKIVEMSVGIPGTAF